MGFYYNIYMCMRTYNICLSIYLSINVEEIADKAELIQEILDCIEDTVGINVNEDEICKSL